MTSVTRKLKFRRAAEGIRFNPHHQHSFRAPSWLGSRDSHRLHRHRSVTAAASLPQPLAVYLPALSQQSDRPCDPVLRWTMILRAATTAGGASAWIETLSQEVIIGLMGVSAMAGD